MGTTEAPRHRGQDNLVSASTVNIQFRNVSPAQTLRERSNDFSRCRLKSALQALQNFLVDLLGCGLSKG